MPNSEIDITNYNQQVDVYHSVLSLLEETVDKLAVGGPASVSKVLETVGGRFEQLQIQAQKLEEERTP